MGFFGALLVRAKVKDSDDADGREGKAGIETVRGPGAFAVLESVTLPDDPQF